MSSTKVKNPQMKTCSNPLCDFTYYPWKYKESICKLCGCELLALKNIYKDKNWYKRKFEDTKDEIGQNKAQKKKISVLNKTILTNKSIPKVIQLGQTLFSVFSHTDTRAIVKLASDVDEIYMCDQKKFGKLRTSTMRSENYEKKIL